MAGTSLIWDLLAVDHASPAFLKVAGAADKAAASTQRATTGLAASLTKMSKTGAVMTKKVTLPLLAIGAVSVAQAAKWQKSMTLIQTAGGETAAKASQLSAGLMKVATQTGTSLDALGEGIYTIAKAGAQKWSATEQLLVMKAAAEGAKAENVSLATATDALSTVMLDYHTKASKAVGVENQLIRASGLAKTSFGEFSASLSNVTPIAAATGLSFKEIGGAIATMTQHGVSAQQATENLRNLIFNLAGQNNVASAAMQQLGINTVDLAKNLGKRGLSGTIAIVDRALRSHTKNGLVVVSVHKAAALATSSLNKMLGTMGGRLQDQSRGLLHGKVAISDYTKYAKSMGGVAGASALQFLALYKNSLGFSNQLKSGKGTLTTTTQQYQKMLGGMTGAAVAMQIGGKYAKDNARNVREVGKAALEAGSDVLGWNKTQDTLAVKMDKAKASLQVMAVEIGTALIPAVSKLADLGSKAAHWFDGLSSTQKKVLGWSLGVMAALGPLMSIGARLALVGRSMGTFVGTVGTKMSLLAGSTAEQAARVGVAMRRMGSALAGAGIGFALGSLTKNSSTATKSVGVLAATLTGAALGSGFGPWGAAIGGASAGLSALAANFLGARDATKKETDALNEQKQAALDLAGVLSNTAFNKQASAIKGSAIAELTKSGAYDNTYSISPTILTNAALGSYGAIQRATNVILRANGDLGKSWNKVSQTSKDAIRSLNQKIFDATERARQAEVDYENMSVAAGHLGFAHVKLSKEVKQFGASLDTTTAYGQRNTFVITQQAKGLADLAVKNSTSGVAAVKAAGQYTRQEDALRASAIAAGFNKSEVEKLTAGYQHLPKQVVTQLKKIGVTPGDIEGLISKYGHIPKAVLTAVNKKGVTPGEIQAIIDKYNLIPASKSTTVTTVYRTQHVNAANPGTRGDQTVTSQHKAAGGGVRDGYFTAGERGWELGHKQGSKVTFYDNKTSQKMTGWNRVPGFANGTTAKPPKGAALQGIVSNISALLAAGHNLMSSASELASAAKALRTSAREQKLSAAAQKEMAHDSARLVALGRSRDSVRARLGTAPTAPTAYDQLATAQQTYKDSRTSVAGSVGAFDITTAGVNAQVYNDQAAAPVSAGSILGQLKAAASKAKRFGSLLKTLIKKRLPKSLVEQLAQAGPAAYDQAVALSAATPAELLGIKSAYSTLTRAGNTAGTSVANAYYKSGVTAAQSLVNGLTAKDKKLDAAIDALGDRIVSRFERRLGIKQSPSLHKSGKGKTEHHYHVHGIEDPKTFVRKTEDIQARKALAGL